MVKKLSLVLSCLLVFSATPLMAQDYCRGNFDCDEDCDGTDAALFKADFGRSGFDDPCSFLNDCPNPWAPCPSGMVVCDFECIDPTTDNNHCDGCNTPCGIGEICTEGACMPWGLCPSGQIDCGGSCIDPLKDRDYCGADADCLNGDVCESGEICNNGVCVLSCAAGLTECGGLCVDTDTDESNCGSCDAECESYEKCIAGICDEVTPLYPAPVPKTGQTASDVTGDDGDLEEGVAWPNPRFTDNGDGTVIDNLTGLIWLQNANCFGGRQWAQAISDCNGLASGSCGIVDGSSAGDWRLPNRFELESLLDLSRNNPSLPFGHPFNSVQSAYYWSSTSYSNDSEWAWAVLVTSGDPNVAIKTHNYYLVWPVRGVQ